MQNLNFPSYNFRFKNSENKVSIFDDIRKKFIILTPEESWRPRAAVVAYLGHALARAGHFTDPDRLTPLYLRRPEAEEKWEQLRRRRAEED